MVLDIEELEQRPTNKIEGFSERIELFPSMYEHRCSKEREGGFFEIVKKGPGWGM